MMVEAPNLLGVHPTSMSYVYTVFEHLDMLWMASLMDFMNIGVWVSLSEVVTSWLRHEVHPSTMSYVYKVFQHLDMLWMAS